MPQPAEDAPPNSGLLSYGETSSLGAPTAEPPAYETKTNKDAVQKEPESASEAALFAYMAGEPDEGAEPAESPVSSRRGKAEIFAAGGAFDFGTGSDL